MSFIGMGLGSICSRSGDIYHIKWNSNNKNVYICKGNDIVKIGTAQNSKEAKYLAGKYIEDFSCAADEEDQQLLRKNYSITFKNINLIPKDNTWNAEIDMNITDSSGRAISGEDIEIFYSDRHIGTSTTDDQGNSHINH